MKLAALPRWQWGSKNQGSSNHMKSICFSALTQSVTSANRDGLTINRGSPNMGQSVVFRVNSPHLSKPSLFLGTKLANPFGANDVN